MPEVLHELKHSLRRLARTSMSLKLATVADENLRRLRVRSRLLLQTARCESEP